MCFHHFFPMQSEGKQEKQKYKEAISVSVCLNFQLLIMSTAHMPYVKHLAGDSQDVRKQELNESLAIFNYVWCCRTWENMRQNFIFYLMKAEIVVWEAVSKAGTNVLRAHDVPLIRLQWQKKCILFCNLPVFSQCRHYLSLPRRQISHEPGQIWVKPLLDDHL